MAGKKCRHYESKVNFGFVATRRLCVVLCRWTANRGKSPVFRGKEVSRFAKNRCVVRESGRVEILVIVEPATAPVQPTTSAKTTVVYDVAKDRGIVAMETSAVWGCVEVVPVTSIATP